MLATSRVKRTRDAVGRDVDVLVDVGAVEEHRVVAGLALDDVAAVAGVPDEGVVAGAHEGHVVAASADDQVVALAADEDVVAVAAVQRQRDRARVEPGGVDRVVAAQGVDREAVVRAFRMPVMCTVADRPATTAVLPAPEIVMESVASRAVDDDGVGLAVAGAAAGRAGEVEVDLGDVGAGQVVDGDGVGAAEGVEVDLLDAVEVHGDVGDVAGEPDRDCRWPRCRCSR